MSIHVALHHRSRYRYHRPVAHGPHAIRLRPAPHARPRILGYSLRIVPEQHCLNWQQDAFGNYLARVVIPEPCREFLVEVDLVAEMAVYNPFDFFLEPAAETYPFVYEEALRRDLAPFLEVAAGSPLLEVEGEQVMPTYEDAWCYLRRKGLCPAGVRVTPPAVGLRPGRDVPESAPDRIPATGESADWIVRPAECLHPTIGVHGPLTFDIHDSWSQRSIGGCRYHVVHPGGRNYVALPVNAFEAESRRSARFFSFGHSPGVAPLAAASVLPEFPFTLDLRHG